MARLHPSFVLGFHGCIEEIGIDVVLGKKPLNPSVNKHDWLGKGVYFWEADPVRAWEWADAITQKKGGNPFVLGAVIDLGNCLDLASREGVELVKESYHSFVSLQERADFPLPQNLPCSQNDKDCVLRNLDCAVIEHLHSVMLKNGHKAFNTVRGVFHEGDPLYKGSGLFTKTHVQIAVRMPENIKGLYLVKRHHSI